jgi:hypothetical protein
VFSVLERSSEWKRLELLERLERLAQASLRCVQSEWGLNLQVKRKILSDNPRRFYKNLKHHSLPQKNYFFLERLNRAGSFSVAIYRASHYFANIVCVRF